MISSARAEKGEFAAIPGMGEKSEAKLLATIEAWAARAAGGEEPRRLRAVVEPHAAAWSMLSAGCLS